MRRRRETENIEGEQAIFFGKPGHYTAENIRISRTKQLSCI